MGRALLCVGKYAETPYRFESICVNVYCVEELCYLLSTNPFVADGGIMNRELAEWIDRECGLTNLSHQLLLLLNKGMQPGVFIDTILDYVGYNTQKERERIRTALSGSAGLSQYERRKKQADYLLKNKRFRSAVMEYDKLLSELPETENTMKAAVCHNMGVAYGKMFQFESAAEYFREAYETDGDETSAIQYLIAVRKQLTEGQYISFIADKDNYYELSLKVEKLVETAREQFEATRQNRMLSALTIYKEEGNTASYYREIDKIIEELKDSYRACVSE